MNPRQKTLLLPSLSGRQKNSIMGIQRLNVWNQSNILVSTYPTILTSKSRSKIKSYNLIYLVDQPECLDRRHTVTNARPILINLKHFQDVEIIHRYKGPYTFQAYKDKSRSEIDGFHLKFCKTSLNVSNYASNSAVLGELGRYPLTFMGLLQVIEYWIRLSNGTKNDLLNSAFKMASIENNSWIQAIYFMLSSNGYRESWLYPHGVDGNFHLAFRQRLRDQFIQHWKATIHASDRFRFLCQVKEEFRRTLYIDNTKSPEIRWTYTRLRMNNNLYSSYMRSKVVGTCTCPVIYRGEDTIKYLLFSCQHFDKQRMEIDDKMCKALPNWPSFDISTKFKLLLDLLCPAICSRLVVHMCMNCIHNEKNISDYFRCRNLNIARLY